MSNSDSKAPHDRDVDETLDLSTLPDAGTDVMSSKSRLRRWFSRSTYTGAVLFNVCAFALPALYGTLVKLWIAQLDSNFVATTDAYTYISVVVEVINEGLPRAAWVIIGNKTRTIPERLRLCFTLIAFQMVAGLIMSLIFVGAASEFADAFVPSNVREASVTYVRISAFVALTSATDVAISMATRALDRPDVPLMISLCKTVANIIFDLMFLSTFRIKSIPRPTVNTQAGINLACNAVGSLAGLIYFGVTAKRLIRGSTIIAYKDQLMPTFQAWKTLARPGAATFWESAIRNALYLWLVHGIVDLGSDYATAWGVFNTIRWGLVMVPVYSLEAASAAFVGHEWGMWHRRARLTANPKAAWSDIIGPPKLLFARDTPGIIRPALRSVLMVLIVELPLCLAFSLWAAYPFAVYLSGNPAVARITARMWRTIDWCYIFYAVNQQLASILLATRPKWFLGNSVVVNVLWVFPWAVALEAGIKITESSAWRYHAVIFGGSMVLSFIVTIVVLAWWLIRLRGGKMA